MTKTHEHVQDLPPWDKWLFAAVFVVALVVTLIKGPAYGAVIGLLGCYAELRHSRIVLSKKKAANSE